LAIYSNREHGLKTQNKGVFLTSSTSCVTSKADQKFSKENLAYYGKVEDIIELNYYGNFKVTLFKCKWVNTTRDKGFRKDPLGLTCIKFSRLIHMEIMRSMIHILKLHKLKRYIMSMMRLIRIEQLTCRIWKKKIMIL